MAADENGQTSLPGVFAAGDCPGLPLQVSKAVGEGQVAGHLSGIKQQDKKIRYFDFLSSLEYEGCNAALKRIGPRLHMEQICRLIDETPCLSGLQRRFYKEILALRKERIIDYSLQRLQERERSMLPGHTKKPSRDTER